MIQKVNLAEEGCPHLDFYATGEIVNLKTGKTSRAQRFFYTKDVNGKKRRLSMGILTRRYFCSELMRIPPDYVVNLEFLGYPDYSVTIDGRIWTHVAEQWLSQTADEDGFISVKLCRDGKSKSFKLHRLVAMAFVPNPFHYSKVIHVDGNNQNNMAHNLKWISFEDCMANARSNNDKMKGMTDEAVEMACKLLMDGHDNTYIARLCGTTPQVIRNIRNGESYRRISCRYGITAGRIPQKYHRYYIPKKDIICYDENN